MKRLCWLVGHTEVWNDSGYPICSCGSNLYWDQDDIVWNRGGVVFWPIHFLRRIFWNGKEWMEKWFRKCGDCHKFEKFFGKNVGNHDDCVPF